jgi:putative nucleotidyltransferase with HDIG domain
MDVLTFLPVSLLAILITLLIDTEVALLATICLAMLFGLLERFSFAATLHTVIVGTMSAFLAANMRRRSDAFRVVLLVGIATIGSLLLIRVVTGVDITQMGTTLAAAFGVSAASTLVCIFILVPIAESLFGFTTDIRLLELTDLNHPVLKRLAVEASGTYHHSLQVSNLSEAAAKAIGGNVLLTRAGALFHDIGKMEIPEYFVENQMGLKSRHESLAPTMSALILSSHVKRGRKLGEDADLPDDVLNFIEEHHGTMVMSYFFKKAQEQASSAERLELTETNFRYPGPKPQSRETGIVMLADAVEASSRTLDEPKPARIESLIQKIVADRFSSGELDECPLTLRDLAKIRHAFAQVVIAMFHQRVHYPKGIQHE